MHGNNLRRAFGNKNCPTGEVQNITWFGWYLSSCLLWYSEHFFGKKDRKCKLSTVEFISNVNAWISHRKCLLVITLLVPKKWWTGLLQHTGIYFHLSSVRRNSQLLICYAICSYWTHHCIPGKVCWNVLFVGVLVCTGPKIVPERFSINVHEISQYKILELADFNINLLLRKCRWL